MSTTDNNNEDDITQIILPLKSSNKYSFYDGVKNNKSSPSLKISMNENLNNSPINKILSSSSHPNDNNQYKDLCDKYNENQNKIMSNLQKCNKIDEAETKKFISLTNSYINEINHIKTQINQTLKSESELLLVDITSIDKDINDLLQLANDLNDKYIVNNESESISSNDIKNHSIGTVTNDDLKSDKMTKEIDNTKELKQNDKEQ